MVENNESNFNKWFRSEVAAAFALGSVVAGGVVYLMAPVNRLDIDMAVIQNQVAELKSNDLTHIELEETAAAAKLDAQQAQIIDLSNKMTEVLTILKRTP